MILRKLLLKHTSFIVGFLGQILQGEDRSAIHNGTLLALLEGGDGHGFLPDGFTGSVFELDPRIQRCPVELQTADLERACIAVGQIKVRCEATSSSGHAVADGSVEPRRQHAAVESLHHKGLAHSVTDLVGVDGAVRAVVPTLDGGGDAKRNERKWQLHIDVESSFLRGWIGGGLVVVGDISTVVSASPLEKLRGWIGGF